MMKSKLKVKGSTLSAMEDVLEKLRCLNYEQQFIRHLKQRAVSRDEFILPAKNTGMQFNLYIELIKWLLSQINKENNIEALVDFLNVDVFDDPNVIGQKLMLSLRELDYDMDFPMTMLKQPNGEVATSILNFLTDRALQSQNFQNVVEPIYISENIVDKENTEDESNNEEEIIDTDDETFDDSRDSIELCCYPITNIQDNSKDVSETSQVQVQSHDIITSDIDPTSWRAELERVSPDLDINFDDLDNDTTLGKSWRRQVSNALLENEKIVLEMNRSKDALQRLSKESNRTLEMINVKERIINEKFKNIIDENNFFNDKLMNLVDNRNLSSSQMDELKAEFSLVSKKLDEVKMKVDEKGNQMTDTNPLLQIKTTLKEIKAEIREYDLQIGILEHNLLKRRLLAKVNAK